MFIWSVRLSTLKFAAALLCGVLLVTALVFLLPDRILPESGENAQNAGAPAHEDGDVPAGDRAENAGAPHSENEGVRMDGLKELSDMAAFLQRLGYSAELPPVFDRNVVVPRDFSGCFPEYAALQRAQGFDFDRLGGREVRRVTFTVRNEKTGENCLATLFVERGCLVGADLCASLPQEAVRPLLPDRAETGA